MDARNTYEEYFPLEIVPFPKKGRGTKTRNFIPKGSIVFREEAMKSVKAEDSCLVDVSNMSEEEFIPGLSEEEMQKWEHWMIMEHIMTDEESVKKAKELTCTPKESCVELPQLKKVLEFLRKRNPQKASAITEETIQWAHSVVVANVFIMNHMIFPRCIGAGLFYRTSFLNHSCFPNCLPFFTKSGKVIIICTRDVPAGEELTISYLVRNVLLSPYEYRVLNAPSLIPFECACELCERKEDRPNFKFFTLPKNPKTKADLLSFALHEIMISNVLIEKFGIVSSKLNEIIHESIFSYRGSLFQFLCKSTGTYLTFKKNLPLILHQKLPSLCASDDTDLVDRMIIAIYWKLQTGEDISGCLPFSPSVRDEIMSMEEELMLKIHDAVARSLKAHKVTPKNDN